MIESKGITFIIKIEKTIHEKKTYYIATCKQLPGFLVQGRTKAEIHKLVPELLDDFILSSLEKNIPEVVKIFEQAYTKNKNMRDILWMVACKDYLTSNLQYA